MTAEPVAAPDSVPLRRNRDFFLLWTGAGFSELGARMSVIAFPLVLVWYEQSPLGAGIVAFAGLLPSLVLQLPAGVLVDRWDRRRLMVVCDAIAAVAMASAAVALAFGVVWLPHLCVVAFLEGSCMIFYLLAERAAVRNVVEPDQLPTAISQNEARGRAAGLLGQPAGSALFAVLWWLPFAATAVGHLVALTNVALIRKKLQAPREPRPLNLRRDLVAGVHWLWGQKFMRSATLLVAATNFLAQIVTLTAILMIRDLGGSAAITGLIGTAGGIGGVCGALLGAVLLRRLSLGGVVLLDLAARAVLIPVMAFTTVLPLLFVPFVLMSFSGAVLNVGAGSYLARIVPDELHGRAMSAILLTSWGANSAGALVGGLMLTTLAASATLLWAGGFVAAILVVAVLSPTIRGAGAR